MPVFVYAKLGSKIRPIMHLNLRLNPPCPRLCSEDLGLGTFVSTFELYRGSVSECGEAVPSVYGWDHRIFYFCYARRGARSFLFPSSILEVNGNHSDFPGGSADSKTTISRSSLH